MYCNPRENLCLFTKLQHSLPKTLHSLINFAFAHKIFLFSCNSTAFPEKLFCLCTKLLHYLNNVVHYPRNFAIPHKTFSVLSQKYCIPQKMSVLLHLLEKLLRTLNTLLLFTKCVFLTKVLFTYKMFASS